MTKSSLSKALQSLLFVGAVVGLSACSPTHDLNTAANTNTNDSFTQETLPTPEGVIQPETIDLQGSAPYPVRNAFQIKAIQPDSWENRQELLDAGTGGVALNFKWSDWQQTKKTGECIQAAEVSYGGHCFHINRIVAEKVNYWSSKGVVVTAVLWGVPEWARIKQGCDPVVESWDVFCAPEHSADFARFAGMLADRFDGQKGYGRIADFVIHNEVNMNQWYNVGCGNGVACDESSWVETYTRDYNAAYDAILAEQPSAKVFVPFAHQFGEELTNLSSKSPILAAKTFIKAFDPLTAGRKWRIAFHPYPKSLMHAEFAPDDLPHVTYGNIGVLAGWLRSRFPYKPEAWELQLTESGISSLWLHSSEEEQAAGICDSFRNILGTPGIESHVYHRMVDHEAELADGGAFGLHNVDRTPKQAWNVWSTMNGKAGERTHLDCGFENVPYTVLTQYTHEKRESWASTRLPPEGYEAKSSWKLFRDYREGSDMLYECANDKGTYISSDVHCGGKLTYGPVGYAYSNEHPNTVALYACAKGDDRYTSEDAECGSGSLQQFLGFAVR